MQKALETTSGSGHKERSLIASVFCKRDAKKHGQLFFHPDFTVGSGFAPDQSLNRNDQRVAGFRRTYVITAGREFHPALKILRYAVFQ